MEPTNKVLKSIDEITIDQINTWRVALLTKAAVFHQWMILYRKDPRRMILGEGGQYNSVASIVTNWQVSTIEARDRLSIFTKLAKDLCIDIGDFDSKIEHLVSDESLNIPRLVDDEGNTVINKAELDSSIEADNDQPGPMGEK